MQISRKFLVASGLVALRRVLLAVLRRAHEGRGRGRRRAASAARDLGLLLLLLGTTGAARAGALRWSGHCIGNGRLALPGTLAGGQQTAPLRRKDGQKDESTTQDTPKYTQSYAAMMM